MNDLDERARRAGAALRTWAPSPSTPATGIAAAAVRRTRRRRAAAATVLLGLATGIGLVVASDTPGHEIRTVNTPADLDGRRSTSTSSTTAPTTAPTIATTATTVAAPAPAPAPAPVPTTVPAPPPPAPSSGCAGEVGGVGYELTLPDGWYANEPWEEVPACRYLGPEPVQLSRGESESGFDAVVSNAPVWLWSFDILGTFEERVASAANRENVVDFRRDTVDGRPAARIEEISTPGDDHLGGERYVGWWIDLGDVALRLQTDSMAHAAQLDAIVQSLRFSV
jgi:hypothetical protein